MNRYYDLYFKKNMVTIYPGEFWSSTGSEMISTVLGSCVSIILYDAVAGVGGMNHFMLARDKMSETAPNASKEANPGKFGEYAMDLLIDDMEEKGAQLSRCVAKVFGGGNIFTFSERSVAQVGEVNIQFAFNWLNEKNIKIVSSDTGGTLPRKIFFDPATCKVFLKYIKNAQERDNQFLKDKEVDYMESLKNITESLKSMAEAHK